jgi:hypothetical protein
VKNNGGEKEGEDKGAVRGPERGADTRVCSAETLLGVRGFLMRRAGALFVEQAILPAGRLSAGLGALASASTGIQAAAGFSPLRDRPTSADEGVYSASCTSGPQQRNPRNPARLEEAG